jgi:sRNA-binding protein
MNDTDKPRKTLTITRKPATTGTDTGSIGGGAVKRTGKRIITRAELPNVQPPGKPKTKQKPNKPTNRKPRQPPRPKQTPPSDIRARELSDSLNAFAVWLTRKPLALGIEKQVFRHIAGLHLSASKRVVQKLLHRHTHHRDYLQAISRGGSRFNLDGSEAGTILPAEQQHAARQAGIEE